MGSLLPLRGMTLIGPGDTRMTVPLSGFGSLLGPDGELDTLIPAGIQSIIGPVALGLGDQLFSNNSFANMTVGAEVLADPGFDNAANWAFSAGWGVAGSQATHTGGTSDNLSTVADVTTIGGSYVVDTVSVSNTEDGAQRVSGRWADQNYEANGAGSTINYVAAAGTNNPTRPTWRSAGSTVGSWIMSGVSVKPISLDSWPEIGTRSINEFMVFNVADGTVRIVSGGNLMGISQDIGVIEYSKYYYFVNITDGAGGTLLLNTIADGTLASFSTVGTHTGLIEITDSDIRLGFGAAGDVTISEFSLYPVL